MLCSFSAIFFWQLSSERVSAAAGVASLYGAGIHVVEPSADGQTTSIQDCGFYNLQADSGGAMCVLVVAWGGDMTRHV